MTIRIISVANFWDQKHCQHHMQESSDFVLSNEVDLIGNNDIIKFGKD